MTLTAQQVCDSSTDQDQSLTLSVVMSVIFGIYILVDCVIAALTVGAKAWQPISAAAAASFSPSGEDPNDASLGLVSGRIRLKSGNHNGSSGASVNGPAPAASSAQSVMDVSLPFSTAFRR
ncbi:MAG: hypothetical protein ACKVI4_13810 [Actinomycetales bacterium]|tara:strand:+ start:718 stop:1080 length:363 start_codon:yes stop_codon:yes gene_type:complete